MFCKLKLRPKLLLGFSTIILVTCLLGGMTFNSYMQVMHQFERMHDQFLPVTFKIYELKTEVTVLCNEIYAFGHTRAEHHKKTMLNTLRHVKDCQNLCYITYNTGRHLGKHTEEDISHCIVQFIKQAESTIALIEDGGSREQLFMAYAELHRQRETMVKLFDQHFEKHRSELHRAERDVQKAIQTGIWLIATSIAAMFTIAVLGNLILGRSILRPIRLLQQGARRIGQGDLDHRLNIKTGDELEQLAVLFNVMGSRLKESRDSLEEKVRERTGELTRANIALETQIEQRRTIEEALWQQQEWSRAVIESSKDAMIAIDEDETITLFNPAAEDMFGWKRTEAVGQPIDILMPEAFRRRYRKKMRRLISRRFARDRKGAPVELDALRRDGTVFPVELTIASENEGRVQFEFAVIRDITKRKESEKTLRNAKEEAETANRVKSRFLANISHEIRTPINAIMGFAEIINTGGYDERIEQQSGLILQESDHLLGLINDLLDHAKIESGKLTLEKIPVDVRQMLQATVIANKNRADIKGLPLNLNIDADVPKYIIGDGLRIRQVLANLITNAIKFTDKGSVEVNVKAMFANQSHCRLLFEVIDTGIGIPQDKQETIFESFSQVDSSTTRKFGGTGLGTTISRQLVSMMNGDIGLNSEEGVGSTFWFAVPFEISHQSPIQVVEVDTPEKDQTLRTGRILVAEDYPANQNVVRLHLETAGHEVTIVEDGLLAFEACRNHNYDLVIMDVQMPNMDGNEATRQIRQHCERYRDIPIVAMTAHGDAESHKQCIEAGVNEVITKPVRRKALLETVSKWLKTTPHEKSKQSYDNDDKILAIPFDLETATAEFGSMETILQIAAQFLDNVNDQIEQIREAIATSDVELIRQQAHSVKGGAATLEAHPLSETAKELEQVSKAGNLQDIPAVFDQFVGEYHRLKKFIDDKVIED